jgi:hypothetical protein
MQYVVILRQRLGKVWRCDGGGAARVDGIRRYFTKGTGRVWGRYVPDRRANSLNHYSQRNSTCSDEGESFGKNSDENCGDLGVNNRLVIFADTSILNACEILRIVRTDKCIRKLRLYRSVINLTLEALWISHSPSAKVPFELHVLMNI